MPIINSVLAGGGGGAVLGRIQEGIHRTDTSYISISPVDLSKSFIIAYPCREGQNNTMFRTYFDSTSRIRIYTDGQGYIRVKFYVIEFDSGVRVQHFNEIMETDVSVKDVTIPIPVDESKSLVLNYASVLDAKHKPCPTITSPTNIKLERSITTNKVTCSLQVVEFL